MIVIFSGYVKVNAPKNIKSLDYLQRMHGFIQCNKSTV